MRTQKGKIVFSNKDVWNLDMVLSEVIRSGLLKFKEYKRHGYPNEAIYEYYSHLPENEVKLLIEKHSYDESAVVEYWEACIDKMIFAFSKHKEYHEIERPITKMEIVKENSNSKFTRMTFVPKEGYTHEDVESYNAREKEYDNKLENQINEGRILFIRYYDSLWD